MTTEIQNGVDKPVVTTTVADDHVVGLTPGVHAETVQAAEQGNKEYQLEARAAVRVVDIPAHQREVVLAHSMIPGCAVAAVEAWDAVKGEGDASFAAAAAPFKEKLVNHAESVYQSGQVLGGDTALARFEQKVAEIKGQQDRERREAASEKVA